jgi:hypothetical protein
MLGMFVLELRNSQTPHDATDLYLYLYLSCINIYIYVYMYVLAGLVIMKLAGMNAASPSTRARRGAAGGAMASPQTASNHVPFRDSKLTRILSSSLGGNANTGVLCCVSPTLRYVRLSCK